jgi:hypothetical protein
VFSADGRAYRWSEVLAAAAAYGDWERLQQQALAARPRARREVLTAWRRRRRLLSADETVAWLEHWCIELADVERQLGVRAPRSVTDVDRAAWIEAVCSGSHGDLARGLAARVALAASSPDAGGGDLDPAEFARLDHEYRRRKLEIESSDAVARIAEAHASDWVRVRLRRLTLGDVDAAREAALCVRVDGMSLDDIAALAGVERAEVRMFLDELDADWRPLIESAAVGELCGPLPTGAGHAVAQLLAKDFSDDDPAVIARARGVAVAQAIAREATRFTWHEQL